MHEPSLPAAEEIRGGEAEEDMAVEAEEVDGEEGEGWRAAATEVGTSRGASPHSVAVASGAAQEIVRLVREDDVLARG